MEIWTSKFFTSEISFRGCFLEKSARAKLQGEIVNLGDVNKELKERHDAIMAQVICVLTTSKLFRIGLFADDVGRYQQYTRS